MAIAAEILTHLKADASQFKAEMNSAERSTEGFAGKTDKLAAVGKAAFLGIAGAAAAAAVIGVNAAAEQEEATARLTQSIENAGSTYAKYADEIGKAEEHAISLGFADDDLDAGLSKLVNTTKDVRESVKLMHLAEDIARGRHIDLASATDILVKVESGRVGALARIGIAVKDANGATISQEEAIRRLSDLYGGQASKYADTFRGRLEVLQQQLSEIAEKIGFVLIPIIYNLASAFTSVIHFFEENKELAIALATVIGGPLVAALTLYIAKQVEAAAAFVIGKWAALIGFLGEVYAGFVLAAGGMDIAAISAYGFAAALGAIAWPVAIIGLTAAAFYGLGAAIGLWDDDLKSAKEHGEALADSFVKTTEKNNDLLASYVLEHQQLGFLRNNIRELTREHDALRDRISTLANSTREGTAEFKASQAEFERQERALAGSKAEYNALSDAVERNRKELQKQRDEQARAIAALITSAKQVGVVIPASYDLSTDAAQKLHGAISELVPVFGAAAVQAAINADNTGAAFTHMKDVFDSVSKDMLSSIENFTNVATHDFGNIFGPSADQVEEFFTKTNEAAQRWSGEIEELVKLGVNQGIVDQFAKAGPQTEPNLIAFTEMVKRHGADWVNAIDQATKDAALRAAINAAEMSLVVQAYLADMKDGGTKHLVALAQAGDQNLKELAFSAVQHLGEVKGAVDAIPQDVPITIDVDTANAIEKALALQAFLHGMTQEEYRISIDVGATGAVPI